MDLVSIRNFGLSIRRITLVAGIAACLLTLVGVAAPFIDGSGYSPSIQKAIEATLGRTVQFESIHFTLFAGPGFVLEGVTISEDPQFGAEPFAYVPEMQARLRLDKLLFGHIQLSSLRLLEPSLNLVKRDDGTWNVVELIKRLGVPRRLPLHFFPVFEVLGGRIDFKFGQRKTTLYILDSDLQIYPGYANRLNLRFSGSPARTDRAGNGFGHLHGAANWYLNSNNLDADIVLDPSNLSEVTTLVEGHDVGVHGTVSSRAHVAGSLSALQVTGTMQVADVHRWDLMPASGYEWAVPYQGEADLLGNRLTLRTTAARAGEVNPVNLVLTVTDLLANPRFSVDAHLHAVSAGEVLPLARRMGLSVPQQLILVGALSGNLNLSTDLGLRGNLLLEKATATLPATLPWRTDHLEIAVLDDRLVFRPTFLETTEGAFQVSGEVWLANTRARASIGLQDVPVFAFKPTLNAWFGTPPVFDSMSDGRVTGALLYDCEERHEPVWSGRLQFADATFQTAGMAVPLTKAEGRVSFAGSNLDIPRISAHLQQHTLKASYHYNPAAKHTERLRIEMAAADLGELQTVLSPSLQVQSWLARLGVLSRTIPAWLADRNLEAELDIRQFSAGDTALGSLTSQVLWQGTNLHFPSIKLIMPSGSLEAKGTATLASYRPHFTFVANLHNYPWRGGLLSADADVETSGIGEEGLRNLRASGLFNGTNMQLAPEGSFSEISGLFRFSYKEGWPDLTFTKIQASDGESDWSGAGAADSDGRLVVDLEREGRQRRYISTLNPHTAVRPPDPSSH